MSRIKLINGEKRLFRHFMYFTGKKSVWLPVVRPERIQYCLHDGELEEKSGGYVCLTCFSFIGYAGVKYDSGSDKTFVDLK